MTEGTGVLIASASPSLVTAAPPEIAPAETPVPSVVASARRSLSQTVGLTSGRACAAALSFAWTVVIARSLDTQAVGALSLGLTLAVALSVIPDMGLPMIVADQVARRPGDTRSLVTHVVRLRLAMTLVAGALLLGMYRLGTDATLLVPLFMTVSIAATAVHSTATAALRGLGRVSHDSINEVSSRVLVIGLGCVLLALGHDIAAVAGVLAFADVASAVVLLAVVWRRTTPGTAFPREILSRSTIVPLAAALLVGSLHTRIDVWLLALIGSSADVAHYAIPAGLAEGLLLPIGVAAVLVIPLTAREPDPRTRGRHALRYVLLTASVVAIAAAVVAVSAGFVLETAFGSAYAGDQGVLRLLCLAAVPSAVSIGLAPIVALLDRKALVRWVLVALAVNVALNILLLPSCGGAGAAWATIASMSVAALGMVRTVLRIPPASPGGPSV